jgi:hypothetical protein
MKRHLIKTASWFTTLPDDHQRISISRGTPRGQRAGFRLYRKLAPGPWFNSVGAAEYIDLYRREILDPLNPHQVAAELADMAGGKVATLLCFERAGGADWCHRAMAAAWLAEALGQPVPEFGFETLAQEAPPLIAPELRCQLVKG